MSKNRRRRHSGPGRVPDILEMAFDTKFDSSTNPKFVRAILPIQDSRINVKTIGIRFLSPEHLATFVTELMEEAVKVWPENELVKHYISDESNPPKPKPPLN